MYLPNKLLKLEYAPEIGVKYNTNPLLMRVKATLLYVDINKDELIEILKYDYCVNELTIVKNDIEGNVNKRFKSIFNVNCKTQIKDLQFTKINYSDLLSDSYITNKLLKSKIDNYYLIENISSYSLVVNLLINHNIFLLFDIDNHEMAYI
jgi:hypothetical protein